MKLVFITARNPIDEDFKKHYSRIRFYSDTLVKFAESFKCNELLMLYMYTNSHNGASIDNISEDEVNCNTLYSQNPEKFENCDYIDSFCREKGINCKFESIDTYINNLEENQDDSIVMFGILNNYDSNMNIILGNYIKVVEKSKYGYYYLNSDAELSSHQYVLYDRVGFLSKLGKMDDNSVFRTKFLGVISTEITDSEILNSYKNIGINKDRVFYLPMIVELSKRINPIEINLNNKNGRIMILRNFDKWINYPEFLEAVNNKFDIYESSMPTVRRKYIGIVEKYGGNYKHARFWTLWKMKEILSQYSFYMGMSTPGSDRFTYKIIEATDAGTICILPKINLKYLGIDENHPSQQLLEKYSTLMNLNVENDMMFRFTMRNIYNLLNKITDEHYINRYNLQKEFIYEYFDYNSYNINYCINTIIDKFKEDFHENISDD